MKQINILGTAYTFREDDLNNPVLAEADGICELYDKEIIVRKQEYMAGNTDKARKYRYDHVVRHEIIHAIAEESGVQYGNDEALVDWIASIVPKVQNAFIEITAGD